MLRRYTQRLYILINPQIRPRNRPFILRHRLGRSLEDDVAAHGSAALTEGDVVDGVLVVERLVEIHQLVDV